MNTPPASLATSAASTANRNATAPKTLEQYIAVGAAIAVAMILTVFLRRMVWDITGELAAGYGGRRVLVLRTPLFLVGTLIVWASAISFAAKKLGKSFRNVIMDRRNLRAGQLVLIAWAILEALHITIWHNPSMAEVRQGITPYILPITLLLGAGLIRLGARIYGDTAATGLEVGIRGYGGGGSGSRKISLGTIVLILLGLAITYRIVVSAIGATGDLKRREALLSAEIVEISQGQRFVRERTLETVMELLPGGTSEPILIKGDQAADWWPKATVPELAVLEIFQIKNGGATVWKTNAYPYTAQGTPRRNVDRSIAFRNNSTDRKFTVEFVRGTPRW